jgi:predicted Zn-dependent protease
MPTISSMSKRNTFYALLFLIASLQTGGCASLQPLVSDFNIVSVEEENQLSQKMSGEIAKSMTLVTDPALNAQVTKVGNKLVNALPSKQFTYRFYVVQDASPNAFTIPGGGIYVHTGLFKLASSEGELAGVLAHEIGHAYERHPAKGLSRSYGLETLSGMLLKQNKNQLQQAALKIAKGGILSSYGRGDETEADDIAFDLLKKAGYSPDGLILFFKKLQQISQSGKTPAFLSSHPPTPDRIKRLENLKLQTAAAHISKV